MKIIFKINKISFKNNMFILSIITFLHLLDLYMADLNPAIIPERTYNLRRHQVLFIIILNIYGY